MTNKYIFIIIILCLLGCSYTNKYYQPNKAHHTEHGFTNPFLENEDKSFKDFLNWATERSSSNINDSLIQEIPFQYADKKIINNKERKNQITWIGHSTLLIQYDGINILTDPIFSDRCSPISFLGPKRYTRPAIQINELPNIDYVIISHNHYDHLDLNTVLSIGNNTIWLVPLGLKTWFEQKGITNVYELDWWENKIFNNIEFISTPSQHWSKRTPFERKNSLWCSWAVIFKDYRFWFGGDTGYNPVQFKQIGDKLGPFNSAAIPIGAYEPRWFMKNYHINPLEAIKVHLDVQSEFSIPIHWGTFVLTDEIITHPPELLNFYLDSMQINSNNFPNIAIGKTIGLN